MPTAIEKAGGMRFLRAQGRPITVGLVACSKSKADAPCLARELYRGAVFRLALPLAERTCDLTYIVSAEHGLVELDTELAPYERSLAGVPKELKGLWATRVRNALREKTAGLLLRLVWLAPNPYVCIGGFPAAFPLKGLGTGYQKQRLGQLLAQDPREVRAAWEREADAYWQAGFYYKDHAREFAYAAERYRVIQTAWDTHGFGRAGADSASA